MNTNRLLFFNVEFKRLLRIYFITYVIFFLVYSFLNWFLTTKTTIISADEKYLNFYIPWILCLILSYWLFKPILAKLDWNTDLNYFILCVLLPLCMVVPIASSQNYFKEISQIIIEIEKIKAKAKPIKVVSVPSHKYSSVASKVEITNLQVKGVKFLTENAAPTRAKTIEQIRVCFTLDKNDGIPVGKKELFIQVINPKNEIISVEGLTYEKNNTLLKYSKLAKFDYTQQVTDVCSYVDLEKNKTIKGRYIINLYSGTTKISTTLFKYN